MRSIRNRIVFSSVLLIIFSFIAIGFIVFYNLNQLSNDFEYIIENSSRDSLNALTKESQDRQNEIISNSKDRLEIKGYNILERDYFVLKPMMNNNDIDSIRGFLDKCFTLDTEVVLATFFVQEKGTIKAWFYSDAAYEKGLGLNTIFDLDKKGWSSISPDRGGIFIEDKKIMDFINIDESTVESTEIDFFIKGVHRKIPIFDCCIPIFAEDLSSKEQSLYREKGGRVGYLRYCLTQEPFLQDAERIRSDFDSKINTLVTKNSNNLHDVKTSISKMVDRSLTSILISAVIVILFAMIISMKLAGRLTNPIKKLKTSAEIIAAGNYEESSVIKGQDEISLLSQSFDSMRLQVRSFTKDLQEMVDVKTKEITEILNSIDQGILTINKDLSINLEHSKKLEDIFGHSDFNNINFSELVGLDPETSKEFSAWFEMVSIKNKIKRWDKYSKLCPLLSFEYGTDKSIKNLLFDYQPIIKDDELSRLMIIVTDNTEKLLIENRLQKNKEDQSSLFERVSAVIGCDMGDLGILLDDIQVYLKTFYGVESRNSFIENQSLIKRLLHTLKGSAGSFGFEKLSGTIDMIEDEMDDMTSRWSRELWVSQVNKIKKEFDEILKIKRMIYKNDQNMMLINKVEYDNLVSNIKGHAFDSMDSIYKSLLKLEIKPFSSYCSRYSNILKVYSKKRDKDVNPLLILTPNEMLHRSVISSLDEIIIHLIRNAIDHGIESHNDRITKGKGVGLISISLNRIRDKMQLQISDDGKGIDINKLKLKLIEKNIYNLEELSQMSEDEILYCIFKESLSTKDEADEYSGRGVGLAAVLAKVNEIHGDIEITNQIDRGVSFRINFAVPDCMSF